MEGIGKTVRQVAGRDPNKRLHSEMHVLADEMSSYFGERKKFGMYLGVIKRLGVAKARAIFASIRSEGGAVQTPRKLFMWLASNKAEKKDDPPDIGKKS